MNLNRCGACDRVPGPRVEKNGWAVTVRTVVDRDGRMIATVAVEQERPIWAIGGYDKYTGKNQIKLLLEWMSSEDDHDQQLVMTKIDGSYPQQRQSATMTADGY